MQGDDYREWKEVKGRKVRYNCYGGDGDFDRPHSFTIEVEQTSDFRFEARCPLHGYNLSSSEIIE